MMRASLIAIAIVCFSACTDTHTAVKIENGIADFSAVEFNDVAIHDLSGSWEYYPHRIIDPEHIGQNLATRKIAPLPQSFNRYADSSLRLPPAASATYRLVLLMPAKLRQYVFRIPPASTASRIFINGHPEAENGAVSEDLKAVVPHLRMRYLQLPLAGKTEIVIQVSNAEFNKGGIWQTISLGTRSAMEQYRLRALILDILVIVALLTFGLYHVLLYFLRHPETSSIYYGLFCIAVGMGRLFTGERLISNLWPSLGWAVGYRIELTVNFADAAFFALYCRQFFPEARKSLVLRAMAISAGIFSLAALFAPVSVSKHMREPFQIIVAILLLPGLLLISKLAWRDVFGARVFLAGVFIIAAGFLNDALKTSELIATPYLFSYSILAFTFLQAVLISGKSVLLFRENNQLSQKLLRSDRLRDDFLSHTSHELRTPVQAMIQTAENLRRGASGAVSEQVQRSLAVMEESGRRLLYLLDDLTDFIRLKHHDISLNIQPVPVKKIVGPVLQLCLGLSDNKQLTLIDELPDNLGDVQVDAARLQQLLLNLISTAIRHSHSPVISLKAGQLEGQLALSVVYNGSEPEAAFMTSASDEAITVAPQVTQRVAELMGGRYLYQRYAESQHALTITLPYADIEALNDILSSARHKTEYRKTADKQFADLPGRPGENMAKRDSGILIISEHASQSRLLQEQLVSLNKQTMIAKNGAEAMLLLQNEPDLALIICDVLLPDVSGIELAMNIRMHFDIGLLPIILIIDSNQAGVAASAFSAGVNDLIRRPFERAEVRARVKNVLLQREASLARENYKALNRELEIARSIQESIIPVSKPKSDNYKIEAVCMPARSIGGDFYDFVEDESSVAILIADVAGHGIPAALYASMLKIAFHNLREQAKFPEKLLKELNDVMVDRGERTFISCAYTLVDFKNKRLLHANAGHLPLLLQEPGRTRVRKIQPPGGVLGVRKAAAITVEMQHLQPKTRLALYTDGVIELINRRGEFFEEDRLIAILEEMRDRPLAEVKERLLTDLRNFAEGEAFLDDVTFVLIDL